MRILYFALVGLVLAAIPATALADRVLAPEEDKIVFELRAEEWIESDSANVSVVVDAAGAAADLAALRTDIREVLARLADSADWRIVRFNRNQGATGLETWRVVAEARLPETLLADIHQMADKASRPGMRARVAHIDFAPTLAEREAALSRLRAELYRMAGKELAQMRTVAGNAGLRLHRVDYAAPHFVAQARPLEVAARRGRDQIAAGRAAAGSLAAQPLIVSTLVGLAATVTLAAPAP